MLLVSILPVFADHSMLQESDVAHLPLTSVKAIRQDGAIHFISDNGRFVIRGELYDVWQKKKVSDFAEMRRLAHYIDLKKIGLDVSKLNTIDFGSGEKQVVVFVSPNFLQWGNLVEQAKKLGSQYSFQLVVVSGDLKSQNTFREKIMAAISSSHDTAPAFDEGRSQLTALTGRLLGVGQKPFLIAPNGRFRQGLPPDLKLWLTEHRQYARG